MATLAALKERQSAQLRKLLQVTQEPCADDSEAQRLHSMAVREQADKYVAATIEYLKAKWQWRKE